jgi:FkbM family methyltransferase
MLTRLNRMRRFTASVHGWRSKALAALMAVVSPTTGTSRPWAAALSPKLIWLTPNRLNGKRLLISPTDWSQTVVYEEIFVSRGYDLSAVPFHPRHIVDCGGHIGMFALLASAAFPRAAVTVFEPNPQNFAYVRRSRDANGLAWDCRMSAVADSAGHAHLEIYNSHSARLTTGRGVPTSLVSLKEFIAALGPGPLILKIDVEGEERAMWSGLVPSLPRETVVFFETHHGADGWNDAEASFERHGFVVQKLVDRGQYCDGIANRGADRRRTNNGAND